MSGRIAGGVYRRSLDRHLVFVAAKACRRRAEGQARPHRNAQRHGGHPFVAVRIDEGGRAAGILEDEGQRVRRQLDVERHGNGAHAHRAEEEFDELQPIADDHADALARLDAEAHQHLRDAIHARVELPVGDASLRCAMQIDDADLVRIARDGRVEEIAEVSLPISFLHVGSHLGGGWR